MKKFELSLMKGGWFVGNFIPAALKTEACEVAVKRYIAGDIEDIHYHKVATEITLILSGSVEMGVRKFEAGDIVVLEPAESCDFLALEDTVTVVVKVPGVINDKYPGRSDD